ncbi:MAG: cobyrinate a,c-diamide synthase [Gammaproteobacteria bacterium]
MSATRRCPALFIAAPASGQGKTTVAAALARRYRDRGLRVRLFKTGPDFLDPMILEHASGAPVHQLDLWMCGEEHCRRLLSDAAGEADLILVEGAMGLYDGDPSGADLAQRFGLPVVVVIDASAMAESFGAIAHGLARYRTGSTVTGVIANRVAGEAHYRMLAGSLPAGVTPFGWLARDEEIALPERHLGLVQAAELSDLDERLARTAAAFRALPEGLPSPVAFAAPDPANVEPLLAGLRIAVARDAAFAFLYRANLDLLHALGAETLPFSPLADSALPRADALYLPGGYPELHLEHLAGNTALKAAVRDFHADGHPILAECGGMLYLLESLGDERGRRAAMAGLLPGEATLGAQLVNIGLHEVVLPEGRLRGHAFHHTRTDCRLEPLARSRPHRELGHGEPIYRDGRLTASYIHLYFPSNPEAAARLFLP